MFVVVDGFRCPTRPRRGPVVADRRGLQAFEHGLAQALLDGFGDGAHVHRDLAAVRGRQQLGQRRVGLPGRALEHDRPLLALAGECVTTGVDAQLPGARPTALALASLHGFLRVSRSASHRSVRRLWAVLLVRQP
jgi:hypothetical protein